MTDLEHFTRRSCISFPNMKNDTNSNKTTITRVYSNPPISPSVLSRAWIRTSHSTEEKKKSCLFGIHKEKKKKQTFEF